MIAECGGCCYNCVYKCSVMGVSRESLLASGVRRIMTLDSNQAGQHRPSGGGGLGEDSNWRLGACRKPKRNPKEGSCCFF